jgi:DNA-binding transcriptional MerR regulator
MSNRLTIGELADAAGVSRRAVRFYEQRGLLPRPVTRGRGAHYEAAHAERLRQILRLQEAGHSLAAIGALLACSGAETGALPAEPAAGPGPGLTAPSRPSAAGSAEAESPARLRPQLVIRLRLAEGVDLTLDTALYNPDAAVLLALREGVLHTLRQSPPAAL